jgi:hypothetical protein
MNGNQTNSAEFKSAAKTQASNTATKPDVTSEEATSTKSKVGRKSKLTTTRNVRYFAGEFKEGIPALGKEFSDEQAAMLGSLSSGAPFFAIEAKVVKVTGIDKKTKKFDYVLIPV